MAIRRRMVAAKSNGNTIPSLDIQPRDPVEAELLARLRAEEAARLAAERDAALAEAEAARAQAALQACLCRKKKNHCGCD